MNVFLNGARTGSGLIIVNFSMEDLLKSFPIQIAEPGQTYYLSGNFLWPLWTYWEVSRPGSQGPAGLITYQKTFLGHTGLIEKFPIPARGARPDLLLIRKLSLAVLDLAPIPAPLLAGFGSLFGSKQDHPKGQFC